MEMRFWSSSLRVEGHRCSVEMTMEVLAEDRVVGFGNLVLDELEVFGDCLTGEGVVSRGPRALSHV